MGLIIIIFISLVMFIVAIISPHIAGKVQKRTNKETSSLKRTSDYLWDPLSWWVKSSLELIRQTTLKVPKWGKNVRKKL